MDVYTMRKAVFLVLLFFISVMAPLASSATTETQFKGGATSYTKTFSGQGNGSAGAITFPFGAEVTSAQFNFLGEASTTTWSNLTDNSDFGGIGTGQWTSKQTGTFRYGTRTNLETANDEIALRGNPTNNVVNFRMSNELSNANSATINATGQFVALGDQGYNSVTKQFSDLSVSSSASWNYRGIVVPVSEHEIHATRYSSTSMYTAPSIQRFNATTGALLGTASLSTSGCTSQASSYWYDAAIDPSGNIWTVSYSYYTLSKWTLNAAKTQWQCSTYYNYGYPYYLTGVDFDDDTGKMFVSYYDSSTYPTYNRYLMEVNPSNPRSINSTWSLGTAVDYNYKTTSTAGNQNSGLVVDLPRIILNEYNVQGSRHHHFTMSGFNIDKMGIQEMPNGGHYGITQIDDEGKLYYSCYHTSYCNTVQRKIHNWGDGSITDSRTPTATSTTVYGQTTTASRSVDQIKLQSAIGYMPTGTSIAIDVSNDNGATWKSISVGSTKTFASSGNKVTWRATLNGTSTATPVLDQVTVQYTTNYYTSGNFYVRSNYNNPFPAYVAATIHYNATVPAGTSLSVQLGGSSSSLCSSGLTSFGQSGLTKAFTTPNYGYICLKVSFSTSNSANTPVLEDIQVALHSNAPENPGFEIHKPHPIPDNFNPPLNPTVGWKENGPLIGTKTINAVGATNTIIKAFNDRIPDTGAGFVDIPIDLTSESSGILTLTSFSVTYTIQTVNLEINIPEGEILHERTEPYEVITRHIVGESATKIREATLTLMTSSTASNPTLFWQDGDVFPSPNDPDGYIVMDGNSYSILNNSILEVHWLFRVTSDFPDQNNVRFKTGCLDDSGSAGFAPLDLISEEALTVNRTFGLGWMKVRDNEGDLVRDDVPNNAWVAAGETLHFQGAMWFVDSDDAPLDSAFDVRVSRNGWVESTARDTTNINGSFFISVITPNIDVPDGLNYEVQTYNERNPTHVMAPNSDWSRTFRVDATPPERITVSPEDGSYEAGVNEQDIRILVKDDIGVPMELTLMYWVEADHDLNRNGIADESEYASKKVTNMSESKSKWFMATIDHSRNPNMGRVSYYWTGGDQAGNPVFYTQYDDEGVMYNLQSGHGFNFDDSTFQTRKDSEAIFTGLEWVGHNDDAAVFAGLEQSITVGFIDANTAIDFEHISLVFDFEGPNPSRDAQRISYSGLNNTFWSESNYIHLLPSSNMRETTNESGLPWIIVTYDFVFAWDWPDEEMGDLALLFKERGSMEDSELLILEHTFRVENDFTLSPTDYTVEDVSEPRTGQVADGTRVRKDDRLAFSGRVVYEGSNVPAPRDVGILVEVFDGEKLWSDGSLTNDGEYLIEVPLDSAKTLQSSPTRTCLISITNIPGRGEDMTGTLVSTTLRVIVDDAAPRVVRRMAPLNVIDVSPSNDLSSIYVEFQGSEDADLTGSEQMIHWVMRDQTRTVTIGAGSSLLGMQQEGQTVYWTGEVDITAGGTILPQAGDFVGFYITGWDAAGNQFPVVSNSEASPIPELAFDDTDFERQWVRLGAVGPELRVKSITVSDDHVSPGTDIEITATVINNGGPTTSQFKVAFFAGDSDEPFDVKAIVGIEGGESVPVTVDWEVQNVDRVRVEVDYGNLLVEVNDNDNTAEHDINIAYSQYLGWLDSPREHPLAWIFAVSTVLILILVATVASRTAVDLGDGAFAEDDEIDWEDDDDDYDDDDYDDDDDD
ncbi:MAG: hypothetical protein CMB36_03890 [Euryarchaeota archaeon]|nr:hypothetical protein [Euryarchaeota archaeon]